MPQRHYWNKWARDMRKWSLKYVDYMHYEIPATLKQVDGFEMPSDHMGQYAVYDSIRHVFSKTEFKGQLMDNSMLVSKRYQAAEMEKAVSQVGSEFRAKHKIDDDAHVIFLNPGNEVRETNFCLENGRRGIKEFLLKYSAPTSLSVKAAPLDKFVTIVSV
jgi:hypothetical protein